MESYDKRMFLCKDRSEYLQYTQVNLFNCAHTRSIGLSSGWNLGKKHRIWPFSINIHSIILFPSWSHHVVSSLHFGVHSYSDSAPSTLSPPYVRVSPYTGVTLTVPGPSVDWHLPPSVYPPSPPPPPPYIPRSPSPLPPPYIRVSLYTGVTLTVPGPSANFHSNTPPYVRVSPYTGVTLTVPGPSANCHSNTPLPLLEYPHTPELLLTVPEPSLDWLSYTSSYVRLSPDTGVTLTVHGPSMDCHSNTPNQSTNIPIMYSQLDQTVPNHVVFINVVNKL